MKKLFYFIGATIVILAIIIGISEYQYNQESNEPTKHIKIDDVKFEGRVTTIADGVDVGVVNLWNSKMSDRKKVCELSNGMKVEILRESGEYYFVRRKGYSYCKGYCMKGFIEIESK